MSSGASGQPHRTARVCPVLSLVAPVHWPSVHCFLAGAHGSSPLPPSGLHAQCGKWTNDLKAPPAPTWFPCLCPGGSWPGTPSAAPRGLRVSSPSGHPPGALTAAWVHLRISLTAARASSTMVPKPRAASPSPWVMPRRAVGLGLCLTSGWCACVFIRETLQSAMGKDSFCLFIIRQKETSAKRQPACSAQGAAWVPGTADRRDPGRRGLPALSSPLAPDSRTTLDDLAV